MDCLPKYVNLQTIANPSGLWILPLLLCAFPNTSGNDLALLVYSPCSNILAHTAIRTVIMLQCKITCIASPWSMNKGHLDDPMAILGQKSLSPPATHTPHSNTPQNCILITITIVNYILFLVPLLEYILFDYRNGVPSNYSPRIWYRSQSLNQYWFN